MASFKATKPRARVPICWHCDRQLYAGGRIYVEVMVDGYARPMHTACAEQPEYDGARIEAQR